MRLFVFSLCLLSVAQCARILGIFPLAGRSHYTAGNTLMKILVAKGHEVTMVSPFADKKPPKNFNEVVIAPEGDHKVDFFSFDVSPYLQTFVYNYLGPDVVNATLSHPKFKEFLNRKEKFDVIILEQFYTEGLKYLANVFDAPLILYSALDAGPWTNPSVANPSPPSYIPNTMMPYTSKMTFFERLDNTVMAVFEELLRNFIVLPKHDKIVREHFPGAPDISQYFNNPAIVLLNGDMSINDPVPKVPSMIDIGGFHITKPKPLPQDLQNILDNAKHGVIYFSLGSNIKSKDMPKEILTAIIRVFSTLKETIIWKWEDEELPGKPDNVVIRKWLPQNDVFAHKNVKININHGGIFSSLESLYHGIPMLGLPIFGDQKMNARRSASNGYGRWIEFNKVTENNLKEELEELLKNPKYSENVKKRSQLLKDKPQTAADKLVFWVEYVIRHKGADHLRVAALNLCWYQYLLLDVIAFLIAATVLFVFSFKYLIRYLLRLCCTSKSKTKVKTN